MFITASGPGGQMPVTGPVPPGPSQNVRVAPLLLQREAPIDSQLYFLSGQPGEAMRSPGGGGGH